MSDAPRVISPETPDEPWWQTAPWYNLAHVIYAQVGEERQPWKDYPIVFTHSVAIAEWVVDYHKTMSLMSKVVRPRRIVHDSEDRIVTLLNQDKVDIESGDCRFALVWEMPNSGGEIYWDFCHSGFEAQQMVDQKRKEYGGRRFDWVVYEKHVSAHSFECGQRVSQGDSPESCICRGTWKPIPN